MKKIKYVYVAGPMNHGRSFEHLRAAFDAADELMKRGYVPFVPHLNYSWELSHHHSDKEWLEWDFAWLKKCDAMIRLPGFSPGADAEEKVAIEHGIPVFKGDYLEQIIKNLKEH